MSKREPLKVGDRVAVYTGKVSASSAVSRGTGVIRMIIADTVAVTLDSGTWDYWYHPKQCRRLKPKAKPREWSLRFVGPREIVVMDGPSSQGETILVREVRSRK